MMWQISSRIWSLSWMQICRFLLASSKKSLIYKSWRSISHDAKVVNIHIQQLVSYGFQAASTFHRVYRDTGCNSAAVSADMILNSCSHIVCSFSGELRESWTFLCLPFPSLHKLTRLRLIQNSTKPCLCALCENVVCPLSARFLNVETGNIVTMRNTVTSFSFCHFCQVTFIPPCPTSLRESGNDPGPWSPMQILQVCRIGFCLVVERADVC